MTALSHDQPRVPGKWTRTAGFSLIELNLVVATIAIVALLVAPTRAPAENAQAEMAGVVLENALRFARDKAAQEQSFYGVMLTEVGRHAVVFRADPNDPAARLDVYNPLTKALYRIDFGVSLRAQFTWAGISGVPAPTSVWRDGLATCADPTIILFDPSGVTRCANPYGARIQDVTVQVGAQRSQVELSIDPYSGRVSRL